MTTFLFSFMLQCFFPIFGSTASQYLGMSIVNPDAQAREYVVTVRNAEGANLQEARILIPPSNQRAFLVSEVTGASLPAPGSIQVESSAPGCFSYLASGDPQSLASMDAAVVTGLNLIVPYVELNTGFAELNHVDTSVVIVNPGASAATVQADLYGLDGKSKGSVTLSVLARGSRQMRVSETFASFLPPNGLGGRTFSGYLRLNANVGIAAWQRLEGVLSQSVLRAKTLTELQTTTQAYIPHFAEGGASFYGSFINIVNPGSSPLDLELAAIDGEGKAVGEPVRITLAAGEGRREAVDSLFKFVTPAIFPPILMSGSIQIREAGRRSFQIAGNVEIFNRTLDARDTSLLYPISDTPATSWILPFVASAEPYFTGYAIQNANELLTVQTDVLVEFVASNGTIIESKTIQLSPQARTAMLVSPSPAVGYLRIRSTSFPVHVFGSIGSRDQHLLEQIPAIR